MTTIAKTDFPVQSAVTLILSDARGIYIPRDFVTEAHSDDIAVEHCAAWGLDDDNREWWNSCTDPEADFYWEGWEWILANAKFTDCEGNIYTLYQEGDLWAICHERMTNAERENFGFDIVEIDDEHDTVDDAIACYGSAEYRNENGTQGFAPEAENIPETTTIALW